MNMNDWTHLSRNVKAGIVVVALAIIGTACADPEEPEFSLPTLSVTNPLCDGSGCDDLTIRAFVWAYPIPQDPAHGTEKVGEIIGTGGCLEFPSSWTVTVYSGDSTGAIVDTTVFTWTPDDPGGIYLSTYPEGLRPIVALTETFVPADAPGWDLRFTEGSDTGHPFTAHLTPAERCTPSG